MAKSARLTTGSESSEVQTRGIREEETCFRIPEVGRVPERVPVRDVFYLMPGPARKAMEKHERVFGWPVVEEMTKGKMMLTILDVYEAVL